MSITKKAKEIMKEAKEYMEEKYENDEGFKLEIKQRQVIVHTYSVKIILSRWFKEMEEHHLYTAEGTGFTYGVEESQAILCDGLKYAFKYFEEYALFKKQKGYMIVEENQVKAGDWVKELLMKLDESNFTTNEKGRINKCFGYPFKRYLYGRVSEDFETYFKRVYAATETVKDVLGAMPLCILENNVYDLLYRRVELGYHGEKVNIVNPGNGQEIEVKCKDSGKNVLIKLPVNPVEFKQIFKEIEEENKMNNLLNPTFHYFKEFIKEVVSETISEDNLKEQFNKCSVNNFNGDWEAVELLFKEMLYPANGRFDKDKLLSTYLSNEDKKSRKKIEAQTFMAQGYRFSLIVYTCLDEDYKSAFEIIVENSNANNEIGEEFIIAYTRQLIKINHS